MDNNINIRTEDGETISTCELCYALVDPEDMELHRGFHNREQSKVIGFHEVVGQMSMSQMPMTVQQMHVDLDSLVKQLPVRDEQINTALNDLADSLAMVFQLVNDINARAVQVKARPKKDAKCEAKHPAYGKCELAAEHVGHHKIGNSWWERRCGQTYEEKTEPKRDQLGRVIEPGETKRHICIRDANHAGVHRSKDNTAWANRAVGKS